MGSFSTEPFRLGNTLKHNHGLLLPLASANSFCVNCHNACNFQELAQKRYLQVIQCLKTVVLQSLSHVQLVATPWTAACQTPLFSTISWSLLKFMSMESVRLPNHLILCYPLFLLPFLASRVFSNELALCIRLSKYWSSSISPFNEYSGLLSSRIDWFDLLAVQGTLNNLIQHHNSKASILQHSTFFMDQLSHTYMITGKVMDYTYHKYIL